MPLLRTLAVMLVLMLSIHARAGGSDLLASATPLTGLTSDTTLESTFDTVLGIYTGSR